MKTVHIRRRPRVRMCVCCVYTVYVCTGGEFEMINSGIKRHVKTTHTNSINRQNTNSFQKDKNNNVFLVPK